MLSLKCKKGHVLELLKCKPGDCFSGWLCDVCFLSEIGNDARYCCLQCSFDLCVRCAAFVADCQAESAANTGDTIVLLGHNADASPFEQILSNVSRMVMGPNVGLDGVSGLDKLTKLQFLDIGANLFCKLPTEISSLASTLRFLNLSENRFDELPLELSVLVNLEALVMSKNTLRTLDCNLLQDLTNLRAISFDNNLLTEVNGMNSLSSLRVINFNRNALLSSLGEMSALIHLDTVWASGGALVDFPVGFENLCQLREVSMASHKLSRAPSIRLMSQLLVLRLSRNQLPAVPDGLEDATSLLLLELSSNQIRSIPSLTRLTRLRALMLDRNALAAPIDDSVCDAPLGSLALYDNPGRQLVVALPPQHRSRLEHLLLHGVARALPIGLSDCVNLSILNLSKNQLESLCDLSACIGLRELRLDANRFDRTPDWLSRLTTLVVLHAMNNRLTNIDSLSTLTNLLELNLEGNQLSSEATLPVQNCNKLAALDLGNNRLTSLFDLSNFTTLIKLDCCENRLCTVPGVESLTLLQSLNLGCNELTELPSLHLLTNLHDLRLDRNRMSTVQGLDSLVNLTYIDLGESRLSLLADLSRLSRLTELRLDSNMLGDVRGIDVLSNLKILNLRSNQLTTLPNLSRLTQLELLWLSYNSILFTVDGIETMGKLKQLYLSSNKTLTSLPDFARLTALKELQFANTNVLTLPPNFSALRNAPLRYVSGTLAHNARADVVVHDRAFHSDSPPGSIVATFLQTLAGLSTLTHLRVSPVTPQNLEDLRTMIEQTPSLSEVCFAQWNRRQSGAASASAFARFLDFVRDSATLRSVAELSASLLVLSDAEFLSFCRLVRENHTLTEISMPLALDATQKATLNAALQANYRLLKCSLRSGELIEICEPLVTRNMSLTFRAVHPTITNICIALAPLNLPPYVLLWIIDQLPHYEAAVNRYRKITLIENVVKSIRKCTSFRQSVKQHRIAQLKEEAASSSNIAASRLHALQARIAALETNNDDDGGDDD